MKAVEKHAFSQSDLLELIDEAISQNGSILIKRPGRVDLVLVAAEKPRGRDTAEYLLASPKNRKRLLGALRDARSGKGRAMTPQQLRKQVKL